MTLPAVQFDEAGFRFALNEDAMAMTSWPRAFALLWPTPENSEQLMLAV